MYELVTIYYDGSKDVFKYEDEDSARKAEAGMNMALGNQIQWTGIRPAVSTPNPTGLLRVKLFNAMRVDMGVMSEHGDNEESLWQELVNADDEILNAYKDVFL